MVFDEIRGARQRIDAAVATRFQARKVERAAKLDAVQETGVLAAAGVGAAVRRALQLTVAEGRATITDPRQGLPAVGSSPVGVGQEAAPNPVSAPRDAVLESIVGFNDCDQINFLEHGLRASRSVCRLTLGGQPVGTGFLVAPGLLLTNHHVIRDSATAADFVAEFGYELDADENPVRPKRFALDPASVFVTSEVDAYDFTLVAVRTPQAPDDLGWLPLGISSDKILEGEPVIVVQHPEGREKQICLFHSEMVDRAGQYIYYTTDTEVGSSGSPAFNRQWQVVGLHHGSAPTGTVKRGVNTAANEGIRISSILASLKSNERIVAEAGLDAALALLTDAAVQGVGRPTAPLRIASLAPATSPPRLESARTTVRVHPPSWYDRPPRQGYDPAFLGDDFVVPLPRVPDALAGDVARLDDGSEELKYTHFSVVMSRSRRLAYFSAANLDGSTAESIPRADRDPDHPRGGDAPVRELEAADAWFFDGRLPTQAQVGPAIYDGTDFDFGHLTRRLDPVWGDARTLRLANDDTFHMTNCTPQHHKLNALTWEHLEEAVYKAAQANATRITVITGPVLDPRDPVIRDVQCPVAFWKIVAVVEAGELRAYGFLQWQTSLVAEIQRQLESLPQLEAAEQWHVPISDIVRLTALDFGPLLEADVKAADPVLRTVSEALVNSLFPTRTVA